MPAVAMSPKAGAHGELCGMLAIRAALHARGEPNRKRVLVPVSAHGTNPATAAQCGFIIDEIDAGADGRVDMEDLKDKLADSSDIAGMMLTNPNTCGLFERDIVEIAELIHDGRRLLLLRRRELQRHRRAGAAGRSRHRCDAHQPAQDVLDARMAAAGPGSGPTVLSKALAPYAPVPFVVKTAEGLRFVEHTERGAEAFGRMCAFHGQMGMFTRALTYILSHGADGLRQVAEDATLNANYILAQPERR